MAVWAQFGVLLAIAAFYFLLAVFIILHILRYWGFQGKARRR